MTTHREAQRHSSSCAQNERSATSTARMFTWLAASAAFFTVSSPACGDDGAPQGGSPQESVEDLDASEMSEDAQNEDTAAGDGDAAALDADEGDAVDDETADAGIGEDTPDAEDQATLAPDCQGGCREQSLSAERDDVRVPFTFAAYGLTDAAISDSGELEVLLEVYSGGEAVCPGEDSPTPASTLILSGLMDPPNEEQALTLSLLDFEGRLLDGAPLARAEAVSGSNIEAQLCGPCLGEPSPSHDEGFVSLNLTATFPEGITLSGHIFAIHCDSLDLTAP